METYQIQMLTETFEGHAVADHFVDVNKMVESNAVNHVEFDGVRNLSKLATQP
jgi:hypothetical protein